MAQMKKSKSSQRIVYLRSVEEIPEFESLEEEAAFWDTHSPVEILDQLEPVKLELTSALRRKLEERYQERLLSVWLKPHQIKRLKEIAKEQGIDCFTLVKRWIEAGIETQ